MTKTRIFVEALGGLLILSNHLFASEGPEDCRLEISVSMWRMNTNGLIRADDTPINLISDLGTSAGLLLKARYAGCPPAPTATGWKAMPAWAAGLVPSAFNSATARCWSIFINPV